MKQNHSFVPLQVLEYLPIVNPFLHPINKNYAVNIDNNLKFKFCLSSPLNKKAYIRDAWSYEDVRLYLLEKGYRLCDTEDYGTIEIRQKNTTRWNIIKVITRHTFEAARKFALIYILNEITNGR